MTKPTIVVHIGEAMCKLLSSLRSLCVARPNDAKAATMKSTVRTVDLLLMPTGNIIILLRSTEAFFSFGGLNTFPVFLRVT